MLFSNENSKKLSIKPVTIHMATIHYYYCLLPLKNRTMPLLCKISKEPILHFLGLVKYFIHYTDDVKKVNDIKNNKWIDCFL